MNIFWLSSILAVVSNFGIVIFILLTSWEKATNRIFAGFAAAVGLWGLGAAIFAKIPESRYDLALLWWQISFVGVILVPAFFAHFIFKFLELNKRKFTFLIYIVGLIFLFLNFYNNSKFFIGGLKFVFNQFYWIDWFKYKNSIFLFFYVSCYSLLLIYSVLLLIKGYKESEGLKKKRILYIIIATLVGWPGPHANFLLVFGINSYPYLNFLVTLYTLIIAYAVLRHKLFDIEVVIKRGFVYGLLAGGMFAILMLSVYIANEYLSKVIPGAKFIMMALSFIFISATAKPAQDVLAKWTDRYFFQKRYEYRQILKTVATRISSAKTLKELLVMISVELFNHLRPKRLFILIMARATEDYIVKAALGQGVTEGKVKKEDIFSKSKDIIVYLKNTCNPIECDRLPRLSILAYKKGEIEYRDRLEKIRQFLSNLKIDLVVPAFSKGKMLGAVFLGEKKSETRYDEEDKDLFTTLANQAANAIDDFYREEENAELALDILVVTKKSLALKDAATGTHVEQIEEYIEPYTNALEKIHPFKTINNFRFKLKAVANLHDIGKLGIKEDVLQKPTKLTAQEWEQMKCHPEIGAALVTSIRYFMKDDDIKNGILYHQERYDGTGYPQGLKAENIPPLARPTTVLDSFNAMITKRPYNKPKTIVEATKELIKYKNIQFDPISVDAFIEVLLEMGKIQPEDIANI